MTTETRTLDVDQQTEKSVSVINAARRVFVQAAVRPSAATPQALSANAGAAYAMPLVFAKAKGAKVTDIDGNDYIDFSLCGGTNILGHADERVVAAISKAASKGLGFSSPSEAQVRLAEMIVGRFASVEVVFLTHSRARALASAIRVARAETGRRGVVVVRGSVAERIARTTGSSLAPLEPTPDSGESGCSASDQTFAMEADSLSGMEQLMAAHGRSIAAVVLEPFSVSTGVCTPPDGYLAGLRATCDQNGALLVFDDSVSGLRVGACGAEGVTGVAPDLTCCGSELSAGLPLAVLGGRKDVMKNVGAIAGLNTACDAPTDDLAVAAAIVVLQALAESGFYDALNDGATRLSEGIRAAVSSAGQACAVRRVGSLVGVVPAMGDTPDESGNVPVTSSHAFFDALLGAGIMPPIAASAPWTISAAHGSDEIDRAIEAFGAALDTTRS